MKGDGLTNRKRTRDHSDDDESSDDEDNNDYDDYKDDKDDEDDDNEDDEEDEDDKDDEDAFLPEDSAGFCSNQDKDSKSPVVRRTRRQIDNDSLHDTQWGKMFQELVAYKEKHKNTMVPSQYEEDPKLGRWVSTQRNFFKKNELPKERLDQLNSIDFVWRVRKKSKNVKWDDMFQKLVAYKKAYKHTLVPNQLKEDPKFGRWVSAQRQNFRMNGSFSLLVQAMKCHPCSNRKDKLLKERLDKLDSIGFV